MAETLGVSSGAAKMLATKFQPKLKFRWVLEIDGVDAYLVRTTQRPTSTFEPITIDWINTKRYIAGKHEYETLAVTLNDSIAPSGAQAVMEWIRLCFEVVSGRAGYSDFYKRDIVLKLLDPVGTVIELWDIKGAFPINITFGDLDYAASDIVEVALTLRYDVAVLQY